jgi:outer membrane receptor protein involved in Fe transport
MRGTGFQGRKALYAGAAIMALCAGGAGAQTTDNGGIETVVVTATKRAQDVQSVPFTVTALTEKDLTARGAGSVEQAIGFVPGVNFSSNGTNSGQYSIRGVATSSTVVNTQSPVALYIDDINILDPNYPKAVTDLRLFDVSRVEVLEGPQGTLFGSGSLGGAIRVISNKPDLDTFEAETQDTISGTHGADGVNYDTNVMVNMPIITDQLAVRVVGYYQHDAGYIDNVATGENGVNHSISEGGRVELKWQPTTDFSVTATALSEDDRPHDSAYSLYDSKAYQWNGVVPNTTYNRTNIFSLNAVYDFHWATLTSITTYADRKEDVQADFTADADALIGFPNPPSFVTDAGPSRTVSQEVRLASADDQRFRWLIGGVYLDNWRIVDENVIIPDSHLLFGGTSDDVSISDSKSRTREEAVFGELAYDILPGLTATAGARVFEDELVDFQAISGSLPPPSATENKHNETAVTPKFNLSYKVTQDSMVYAQAAEGYRIGQVNNSINDPISGQVVPPASAPDRLWDFELGIKNSLFDDHLMLNASIYRIDWSNIQLDQYTVPSGITFVANAGAAHINGIELETDYRPTAEWDVGGSLDLLQSRMDSVKPTVAATVGDRLPASAPVNLVGFAQYTHPVFDDAKVFARVDAKYVGKEYSDLENSTALTFGDYGAVNVRLGLEWQNYTLTAFIENLTNEDGETSAFPDLTVPVAIRQRPRTIGLTFDAAL